MGCVQISTKTFKWLKHTTTAVQTHAEASHVVSTVIHLFCSDKSWEVKEVECTVCGSVTVTERCLVDLP